MEDTELLTPTSRALLAVLDAQAPGRTLPDTLEAALAALVVQEATSAAPQPTWLRRLAAAELGTTPFTLAGMLAGLGLPTDNGTQRLAGNALRALGYEKRQRSIGGVKAIYWSRPA